MSAHANPPRTLHELIALQAAKQPEALFALQIEGEQNIRYEQLHTSGAAVAALLRAAGSVPGDVVSVVMPNGLNTLRLLLGAMAGGWCVNPVNLLSQPEQMRHVLEHSDCRVVCVSSEWQDAVRGLLAGIQRKIAVLVVQANGTLCAAPEFAGEVEDTDADEDAANAGPSNPSPDSLALLMYTSGTTGVPKGVMLTQANLVANALSICTEHALTPQDRVLAVLPLYHINAFAVTMLAPLASGGSLAMPPKFSAARFWQQTLQGQCTWINLVPTMISYLNEGAGLGDSLTIEVTQRIRFCRSASAALPPEHLRGFEAKFGIGIIETMGLTETVAPSFSNPLAAHQRKLGSVGRASGCEAGVIDAQLQFVPDGSTGELVIRGPNVMRGYYKNPEATAASFTPDGWLRTGDLGHRDSDGFYFVTGRIKELIIKGGENIAPREIDEVLLRHPAVLDAAAVGIPDKHYGQEIMACVVLRDGAVCTDAELHDFCVTHLGPYKTPKVLRFVVSLPRGPSGKVQRLKLLDS